MKYIKEHTNKSIHIYFIGLVLSILYVLTYLVSNNSLLPSSFRRLALYAFIGYGLLVTLFEIRNNTLCISFYSVWYLLVIFVCFFLVVFGNTNNILSDSFYRMIVAFLITFCMSMFIRTRKDFSIFCWGNVIASMIMIALLFMTGNLKGSESARLGDEISGNANLFAIELMYPCMYAIWLLLFDTRKTGAKILLMVAIILGMYAIALSGGRKSFILPFVFSYLLLIFKYKNKSGQIIKYTVITGIILFFVIVLVQNIPVLYNSMGIRIEQMINSITGNGQVDDSTLVRSELRKSALEGWSESPIWGHGFDSFKWYFGEKKGIFMYSHCNQTELLFCGGLILFGLYYGIFAMVLIKANEHNMPNDLAAFSKAAIISAFVFDIGLVSYNLLLVQCFIMLSAKTFSIDTSVSSGILVEESSIK